MDARPVEQRNSSPEPGRVARRRAAAESAPERAPEARPEPQPVREDRVEVSREIGTELRRRIELHRERMDAQLDGRRDLLAAVRKMLDTGELDTLDASRRAADGLLRRGA